MLVIATRPNKRGKAKYSGLCRNCGNVFYSDSLSSSLCSYECRPLAEKSSSWKGGRAKTVDGYIQVYAPNHPRAGRRNSYVREHIIVMEKHLGRFLKKGENVHHKNGIRDDNRIANLELWVSYQPSGQRVKDLIAFVSKTYK